MTKKILIIGDSWGLGEWGHIQPQNTYGVLHNGLEKYLQDDGYSVENISEPGMPGTEIVEKLQNHLINNSYDQIILFMPSIFRNNRLFSGFTSVGSLLEYHQQHIEQCLQKLNNLGVSILLLGGLTKIPQDIGKYKNIQIVISSIVEYLIPIEQKLFLIDVSNQINSNADNDLVNYVYECNKMWDSLENYKDFIPDGMHPNRNGIYKYYQEIKKYLK